MTLKTFLHKKISYLFILGKSSLPAYWNMLRLISILHPFIVGLIFLLF